MNHAEYNKLEGINWSSLKHMRTSPLHYKYNLGRSIPDTGLMRIGRAIHCLVLEPDQFHNRHPVYMGAVRRGKLWDAFKADHPSADPNDILIKAESERAHGAGKAVLLSPYYKEYIEGGQHEVVMQWTDPDTGQRCKGRADTIRDRIIDLKSVSDLSRLEYGAAQMGTHGQVAFYEDGAWQSGLLKDGCPEPVIIAIESVPPYDVVALTLPNSTVDAGRDLYKRLLKKVLECTESGEWPGLGSRELWLPEWAESEAMPESKVDFSDLPRMEEGE